MSGSEIVTDLVGEGQVSGRLGALLGQGDEAAVVALSIPGEVKSWFLIMEKCLLYRHQGLTRRHRHLTHKLRRGFHRNSCLCTGTRDSIGPGSV